MFPLAILALFLSARASAFPADRCTPQREGEVACFSGKLCECRHDPGGTLSGRRAGTRWDCGALRPSCGPVPPADAARTEPLPPFFPPPPIPGWR